MSMESKTKLPDKRMTSEIQEDNGTPSREMANTDDQIVTYTTIVEDKKTGSVFKKIVVATAVAAALVGGAYMAWDKITPTTFSTKEAKTVIEQQENPALKADKLDATKVYALGAEAFDRLNNLGVQIEDIQFRRDATRLWVRLKNSGTKTIHMMPNASSIIVDDKGNQYAVDFFASDRTLNHGLAPGANPRIMLIFPPIKAEAKQLTLSLSQVFNMQDPSWSYNIPFNIPN